MYNLEEFLQGAMTNCSIILVIGGLDNPQKKVTFRSLYVNEIDGKDKRFTCWDIQDGKLVLYLEE